MPSVESRYEYADTRFVKRHDDEPHQRGSGATSPAREKSNIELDDEIRSYVDLLEAEKINSGLAPARARREALLEVEGIEQVKERVRDVRIGRKFEILASDLNQAWRTLGTCL